MASSVAAAATAAAESSAVTIEEAMLIAPAEATNEEPIYLTNYDQQVMFNLESVYLYPPNSSSNKTSDDVVQVLRQALTKLLVPYHFMAGRLQMNSQKTRVQINCNRAGALFAGATTDFTFADLQHTPTFITLLKDLILHQPTSNLSDSPLLTVQVTRFKCGGFVVGISRNHALVGGTSGDEFLNNYASIARGEGLQVMPVVHREQLRARTPPQPEFDHSEYTKISADDTTSASYFTTPNSNLELNGNFGPHMFSWKTFHFPTQHLNSLKSQALTDGSLSNCTTFEALATHVWQARTQSLAMKSDWQSNLLFVVDCRKVLQPPLPKGFTGNTLSLACASLTSHQLSENPFSFCVNQVQQAKARITDKYVRSAVDWLEMNQSIPSVNGGIYLSSWIRFSFLNINFGWGPPSHTMFIPSHKSKDCVVFLPDKQGAGVDVCMSLEPHQASHFQRITNSILKWPPPSSTFTRNHHHNLNHQSARRYSTSAATLPPPIDSSQRFLRKNWASLLKKYRV